MNDATTVALSPETVLRQMKENGVTDVVWLPDSETNWLYLLMKAEPSLRLVGVTREGHACSIAAGLHIGGRRPLILIQNTGMMESGDSIRGWLHGLHVPVVLMVGYRGWTRHGVNTDTRGDLYRTVPARVRPQLLPGGERRRCAAHHHRLRGGRAHTASRSLCWWATSITGSTGRGARHDAHSRSAEGIRAGIVATRSLSPGAAAGTG